MPSLSSLELLRRICIKTRGGHDIISKSKRAHRPVAKVPFRDTAYSYEADSYSSSAQPLSQMETDGLLKEKNFLEEKEKEEEEEEKEGTCSIHPLNFFPRQNSCLKKKRTQENISPHPWELRHEFLSVRQQKKAQ